MRTETKLEVELPDGTILDAPDDADASTVAKNYMRNQKINALRKSDPGEYDPTSKEWQAKYGATSNMTGMDKFMAGAGKAVVDTGRGIKQLALDVASPFRSGNQADEYAAQISESKKLDAPLMNTGAGIGGNLAGTLATMVLPAGVVGKAAQAANIGRVGTGIAAGARGFVNPATLTGGALSGAAQGAIQPVGTDDSRLLNIGLGGATGGVAQAASGLVGRIAQPIVKMLKPDQQKAVDTLLKNDIPLDAAQQSGSTRALQAKRMLTDNPITAGGQKDQFEKTATAFDEAALRTIGETSDTANEATMARAAKRIGGVMEAVAQRTPVKADNQLLNELSNISSSASKELEKPQAAIIHGQIDEIIDKAATNGAIDGKAYQNIRETLGRISGTGSPGVKHWAGQLRNELDSALQRSATGADADALKQARIQWRNLEGISKVVGSEAGEHISPSKLANSLNTSAYGGKAAMVRGRGATDLMRLAKAGKAIIPDKFPQSGTAPRAALQLLIPGAIGAGYGYAKEGDASGALAYGAGGLAAPFALQKLINNPSTSNYLANGFKGPARNLLLSDPTKTLLQQIPRAGLLEFLSQ